jgi:hypothetical protein
VEYVRVNEQVTMKDNNNRKRIQPAMLVRKDELPKQNQQGFPLPGTAALYSTIGSYQPLNLKPISCETQLIKVSKTTYLELRRIQGYTILKLYEQQEGERVLRNERIFSKSIDWIKVLGQSVYVLNVGNLYILGTELDLIDLPYNLGDIHRITVN